VKPCLGTYRTSAELADPVFLNRFGRPLTVDGGLEDMIATLGKRANIQGVRCSPHTLRHSFATNFLLQGGNIFKLSLLMGHTDIETTPIYLRTIQSRQARNGKSVLDELKVG
jgi:integrase/recombinase XerD